MNKQTVDVLGTRYTIKYCGKDEEPQLEYNSGFCDVTAKLIVIKVDYEQKSDSLRKIDNYIAKTLKHELIHAFLYESGLSENSDWADNEEVVDWFAIQMDKIQKSYQDAWASRMLLTSAEAFAMFDYNKATTKSEE